MGMQTASCFMIKGKDEDGKVVARPYTPTSLNDEKGKFEILIKSYPQGKVSSFLHSLKVGDSIEVKGPFPKIKYTPNMKKKIGMVAGGTGITPMLQIIKEVLKNPDDKTEISLIFANNGEDDILLKELLDGYAAKHKNFKVTYVLSPHSCMHASLPVGPEVTVKLLSKGGLTAICPLCSRRLGLQSKVTHLTQHANL